MAKVEFSAMVSSVRGQVRGGIFRGGRAGAVLMDFYSPNSRSANQVVQRASVSDFSDGWYALTETDRELWDKYASMLKPCVSGVAAYLRANLRLSAANHADLVAVSVPPASPSSIGALVGLTISWIG
jgi:hypothetical protein